MNKRLNDLQSIQRINRYARIAALIGLIICIVLVVGNAIRGDWDFAWAYLVALMFSIASYAANKSAEANIKTALTLHHENIQLQETR